MRAVDRRVVLRLGGAVVGLVVVLSAVRLALDGARSNAASTSSAAPSIPATGPRILAWSGGSDSCSTVAVLDPASGASVVRDACDWQVPSPDGHHVARTRDDGSLVIRSLDDGTERALATLDGRQLRPWAWSPTGRYLVWADCAGSDDLRCTSASIGTADGSGVDVRIDDGFPRWSAGGGRVAIRDSGGTWGVGTGAGADRLPFDGDLPTWSPDGETVVFAERVRSAAGTVHLVRASADGSGAAELAVVGCCVGSIDWSPDGRTVLVDARDPDGGLITNPDRLVLIEPRTGTVQTVPWLRTFTVSVQWSPDSSAFLATGVELGRPAPRTSIVFTDLVRIPVALPDDVTTAWSPDGREVALVGAHGGPLTIVSADDGSVRRTLERPMQGGIDHLMWVR